MPQPVFLSPVRKIGSIELDAAIQEDHQSDLEITSNPVEQGANISDHAIIQPKSIIINGGFSSVPFRQGAGITGSLLVRAQSAWEQLVQLQESKELLDVQTGLKLYRNMLITSLSTTQDAATSNSLLFRAQLQEVIIVSTVQVAFPVSQLAEGVTQNRASSLVERGVTASPQGKVASSVLKRVF